MADEAAKPESKREEPAPVNLVDALWVGAYEAVMSDRTVLVPNETVVQIPEGEAKASDNWKVGGGSGKRQKPKDEGGED